MSDSVRPRALVTGASAGIGTAFAEQLVRDGYDVVLVARRRDRLDALAARLGHAEVLSADLADPAGLAAVEERVASDEALTLVVNNAGFGAYRPFVQLDAATLDALMDLQVRAVARLTRAALPGMLRRKQGGIINVASLLALAGTLPTNPLPPRATYAGCKAFVLAFTQTLAGELVGTGVRVQVCLPGLVATEFHTVQGMDTSRVPRMTAADVARAALSGLALGEVVCVPGLEDAALLEAIGGAQRAVMRSANRPELAKRY